MIRASWRFADYRKAWHQGGLVGLTSRAAFGVELLVLRIGARLGVQAARERIAELRGATAARVVEIVRLRDRGLSAWDIAKRMDEPLAHVRAVLQLVRTIEDLQ